MNTQQPTQHKSALGSFRIRNEEHMTWRQHLEQPKTQYAASDHPSPLMIFFAILVAVLFMYVAVQSAILGIETFHMIAAKGAAMSHSVQRV